MHASPLRTITACAAPPRVCLANIKGRLPMRRGEASPRPASACTHGERATHASPLRTNDIGLRCIGSGSFGNEIRNRRSIWV
jgi:hypothetical protein